MNASFRTAVLVASIALAVAVIAVSLLLVRRADRPGDNVAPRAGTGGSDSGAEPLNGQPALHDTALVRAAHDVTAFLRAELPPDRLRAADTVTLYMNPAGDVIQRRLARDQLRDPAAWILSWGRTAYSLAPPTGFARITTRVGRHLNCFEYDLASRVPEVGDLPHVGVRLDPDSADSCLQTWNLTLVFAPGVAPPTLVAVVYDQWEW